MSVWGYDFPERTMQRWEMPAFRILSVVRRIVLRYVIVWHLLTTGPNTTELAPWDATGWRRVKTILALFLPIPARWHYPSSDDHKADSVLIWWSSGITSTQNGLSWSAYYVGVGYGPCWHPFIWEDGE